MEKVIEKVIEKEHCVHNIRVSSVEVVAAIGSEFFYNESHQESETVVLITLDSS